VCSVCLNPICSVCRVVSQRAAGVVHPAYASLRKTLHLTVCFCSMQMESVLLDIIPKEVVG
jgi:hypothetical protein